MRRMVEPYLGRVLLGAEESASVAEAVRRQALFRYTACEGSQSVALEAELSRALQAPHVHAITNATQGLQAALMALQPRYGARVLIPALSYIATANACLLSGLVPCLVDTDATGHMDPAALRQALAEAPEPPHAVVAVHLDGCMADVSALLAVCQAHDVPLIEDAAQAMLVRRKGRAAGTFGDLGVLSFQENKLLSSGEGGAILARDAELALRAQAYTDQGSSRTSHGWPSWQHALGYGTNAKINEQTAAIVRVQLSRSASLVQALQEHAAALAELLPAATRRHGEDVPLSLWLDHADVAHPLKDAGIPLYDWAHLDLAGHPILAERRSPYSDGAPWPAEHVVERCPQALSVAGSRQCLPVPACPRAFDALRQELRGVLAC